MRAAVFYLACAAGRILAWLQRPALGRDHRNGVDGEAYRQLNIHSEKGPGPAYRQPWGHSLPCRRYGVVRRFYRRIAIGIAVGRILSLRDLALGLQTGDTAEQAALVALPVLRTAQDAQSFIRVAEVRIRQIEVLGQRLRAINAFDSRNLLILAIRPLPGYSQMASSFAISSSCR